MGQILCFGDSITWGAWDSQGGWVQRLRKEIDKGNMDGTYYWAVYNVGISGDTTDDLLKRLKHEIEARIENKQIIIIDMGANDSLYLNKEQRNQVAIEKFEKNMDKIVKIAKEYANKIIVLGITSVDESKVDPMPWFPQGSYLNKYIEEYNNIVEKVAKKNKTHFIELNKALGDFRKNLEDGVHPNDLGHEKIFRRVYEYIVKNNLLS